MVNARAIVPIEVTPQPQRARVDTLVAGRANESSEPTEFEHRPSPNRRNVLPLFARKFSGLKYSRAAIITTMYVVVCCAVMVTLERDQDWSVIDAAYFSMAVMSTVGYGDFYPSNSGSRVFTVFMIVVGVLCIFSTIASVITKLTWPITTRGRNLLERMFPQIPVDPDGSGSDIFYKPRPPLIYYCKNLLPSVLITVILQCISAEIFVFIEGWDYGSALYHCIVTATTVGFGDVSIASQGGRAWSCVHILLSVALLGELISTFDELRSERKKSMARVKMLTTRLNQAMLDNLLVHAVTMRPLVKRDGSGNHLGWKRMGPVALRNPPHSPTRRASERILAMRAVSCAASVVTRASPCYASPEGVTRASPSFVGTGLTELEFVLAMMIELEVVDIKQVRPFVKQFRVLDVGGNAVSTPRARTPGYPHHARTPGYPHHARTPGYPLKRSDTGHPRAPTLRSHSPSSPSPCALHLSRSPIHRFCGRLCVGAAPGARRSRCELQLEPRRAAGCGAAAPESGYQRDERGAARRPHALADARRFAPRGALKHPIVRLKHPIARLKSIRLD